MKRLYFDIDRENNKVILNRNDFNYLMSIGHYNDKAIEYIENSDKYDFSKCELLDILKGSDSNE